MTLPIEQIEFEIVTDPERALEVLSTLTEDVYAALDYETTSLKPKDGRVRLTQIWNDDMAYVLDHDYCGTFRYLAGKMLAPTYIAFMHTFEGAWLEENHPYQARLWDVGIMRKCRLGGGGYSLAIMAQRDLKVEMSKEQQTSDWSIPALTPAQYRYAAYDAYITWELFKKWRSELTAENWEGFHQINPVWRANNEMENEGLFLDCEVHQANIKTWTLKRDTCLNYFRKFTPSSVIKNINSNQQVSAFLMNELSKDTLDKWPRTPSSGKVSKKTGKTGKDVLDMSRDVCLQAAAQLPYPMSRWLASFAVYGKWEKYMSTYGEKFITKQSLSGKITSRFNIGQAITMRYSSSSDNLQNIPRQEYVRAAFIAPRYHKEEQVLVLADYSGVEVRVLAELSGDAQLLEDCIYGDVHAAGAAQINGQDYEYYRQVLEDKTAKQYSQFKLWRSRAKVFTFRLLYGAGAGALAISLKASTDEAKLAIVAWADRYPKAYNYRYKMMDIMHNTGFLPVCDGRTIYVRKPDRQLPVAANYPVQGAAATVMYRALIRTHELLFDNEVDATLCATVHDEILLRSSDSDSEIALDCLNEGMRLGWLDVFPNSNTDNLGDSAIGNSWAAKP